MFTDERVIIWLRSTVTDAAPVADGFDMVCVVPGAVKVFAAQLVRKNPCVLATAGSVPVTILPPGPVPTPVVVVLVVVPWSPPCCAFGVFLHPAKPIIEANIIAAIPFKFFMFFILFTH